jgi:Holliday junction DNA helicase RuvA
MAVAILSGLELDELIPALRNGNVALLTHIPGVGRKTAERLVLELREKLDDMAPPAGKPAPAGAPENKITGVEADVLSALVNLGYAQAAAEAAVSETASKNPGAEFEVLLRVSLRMLARKFFSSSRPKA